jgi:hypothetical protein
MLICILCANLPKLRELPQFYVLMVGLLFALVIPVLYIILDQNPFFWILSFAFSTYIRVSSRTHIYEYEFIINILFNYRLVL